MQIGSSFSKVVDRHINEDLWDFLIMHTQSLVLMSLYRHIDRIQSTPIWVTVFDSVCEPINEINYETR